MGLADPLVTIVIPTKDRNDLVNRAIQSALAQTVDNIEVIVADDGSAVPVQPESSDSRLRVIRHEQSQGHGGARNHGLEEARGKWIIFLDDDDTLLPNALEMALDAAASSKLPKPVAVLGAMEGVDLHGRVDSSRRPLTLPKGSHYFLEEVPPGSRAKFGINALVAPVEIIRTIGGFDTQLPVRIWSELCLRLNLVCSIQGGSAIKRYTCGRWP
jgi:GT2 family glycosyltransferase